MTLNISIADEGVVQRLRDRAARHHRSLEGEVAAILETAVADPRPDNPDEIWAQARRRGLSTQDEAAAMVRADRDGR